MVFRPKMGIGHCQTLATINLRVYVNNTMTASNANIQHSQEFVNKPIVVDFVQIQPKHDMARWKRGVEQLTALWGSTSDNDCR